MFFYYSGGYGVTFVLQSGTFRCFEDWNLIPKERLFVTPPEPRYHFVDIPGGNGAIDLTEALTGEPLYSNRTGSWEFYMDNEKPKSTRRRAQEILELLHGQAVKAILDEDPYYYYEGRIRVSEITPDETATVVKMEYNFLPYKRERYATYEEWEWDPFDFENGVIRSSFANHTVGTTSGSTYTETTTTVHFPGSRMTFIPYFQVTVTNYSGARIVINGHTVTTSGQYRFEDIAIGQGITDITITGHGSVRIDYRGGSL